MAAVTAGKLRLLLDRFADALEVGKTDDEAIPHLRILVKALEGESVIAPDRVKASVASLPALRSRGLEDLLSSLRDFASALPSKQLTAALDSMLEVLRADSSPLQVSDQRPASASKPKRKKKAAGTMNKDLVAEYVKQLEAALGDDRKFNVLFESLRSDPDVSQAEAVAIASQFYGKTSAGTPRAKALARVRERHEKLIEFTKSPSSAGRSAA